MFWGQNPAGVTVSQPKILLGPYVTVIHTTPAIIVTINTLSKSNGIQNLKITDLHGHLSFDFSKDAALLVGMDNTDDKDTPFVGIHNEDTSFA